MNNEFRFLKKGTNRYKRPVTVTNCTEVLQFFPTHSGNDMYMEETNRKSQPRLVTEGYGTCFQIPVRAFFVIDMISLSDSADSFENVMSLNEYCAAKFI